MGLTEDNFREMTELASKKTGFKCTWNDGVHLIDKIGEHFPDHDWKLEFERTEVEDNDPNVVPTLISNFENWQSKGCSGVKVKAFTCTWPSSFRNGKVYGSIPPPVEVVHEKLQCFFDKDLGDNNELNQ